LSAALTKLGFEKHSPEFSDSGLLCTPRKALADEALMEKHQNSLVRPKIEIAVSGEHNIFDGRLIKLLCQVELLRSVRAACEMCGMSYSIAWNLLNAAEDRLGYPLVSRNQGGRSGSGSVLTEKGQQLLEAYESFEAGIRLRAKELFAECFKDFF
jgi:molybdate transport repressor ModE-like protein